MKQLEGKIILKVNLADRPEKYRTSEAVMEEASKILEVERYLNDKVAVEIFKKWKVGIRFHIMEGKGGK